MVWLELPDSLVDQADGPSDMANGTYDLQKGSILVLRVGKRIIVLDIINADYTGFVTNFAEGRF